MDAAEGRLSRQVSDELASAVREFCSVLTRLAEDAERGEAVSSEQIERAEEAKLRLENARAFLELSVCRRQPSAVPEHRRAH